MAAAGLVMALATGCDSIDAAWRQAGARDCDAEAGCSNREFALELTRACGAKKECRVSLATLIPGVEQAMLVEQGAAQLEKCDGIQISEPIRRSYHPLCRYVLLRRHGVYDRFLRGSCMDVRVRGETVEFESPNNVSMVDGRTELVVESVRDGEVTLRVLRPPRASMAPYLAPCVGR